MIKGAELKLYSENGSVNFSLSATQLEAIIKMLGITDVKNGEVTCFSDDGLQDFMDKTVNLWQPTKTIGKS